MDFGFLRNPFVNFPLPFKNPPNPAAAVATTSLPGAPCPNDLESKPISAAIPPPPLSSSSPPLAVTKLASFDFQPLIRSLHSFLSVWPIHTPSPITSPVPRKRQSGCSLPLFRPYVAKIPWHGGVRGFLSQLFPRYGHYCGPNWSSGKDGGSLLWDQRPIDWLDFCCYCHDIGYDTHDQAKLLKADLAFLECLERPRMPTKGDAHAAQLYKTMCIAGLKNILIPYRMQLVRLQGKVSLVELMGSMIGKNATCGRD